MYFFLDYFTLYNRLQNCFELYFPTASQVVLVVKNPSANAGDVRDACLIPGLGRCPGRGHGNPLQYSCLENPMDRGAWWATVHRVAESAMPEATLHTPMHTFLNMVLILELFSGGKKVD